MLAIMKKKYLSALILEKSTKVEWNILEIWIECCLKKFPNYNLLSRTWLNDQTFFLKIFLVRLKTFLGHPYIWQLRKYSSNYLYIVIFVGYSWWNYFARKPHVTPQLDWLFCQRKKVFFISIYTVYFFFRYFWS